MSLIFFFLRELGNTITLITGHLKKRSRLIGGRLKGFCSGLHADLNNCTINLYFCRYNISNNTDANCVIF